MISIRRISTRTRFAALLAIALIVVGGFLALRLADAADERGIVLTGLDGGQLREADLDRGAVVIVIWASWSPRCRNIVPQVNAIAQNWGSAARVLTVDFQEQEPTIRQFLGNQEMNAPTYLDSDGSFSKKYGVTTLPGLLIFRDGNTAYRGRLPRDPDSLIRESLG